MARLYWHHLVEDFFGVKKRSDINKHYKNLLVNCNTIRRSYNEKEEVKKRLSQKSKENIHGNVIN